MNARVAAPMVVTALSEVLILLGLAAAIGYPVDLAVIAGFIAVIGTGVDDLIIIADEVMAEGDVRSRRVFQSRFRRAFWVIGAAAATTIIAMGPLAVLSLGDLQGFAIFTILGVLVGVLITRPAYGDILRAISTDARGTR
jgi:preprotein translocase subunit SecD